MSRILPVRSTLSLLKPGLGIGILISSLPGFLTGFSIPKVSFIASTLLGLFLVASSSFVYNQIYEQKLDAKMRRTKMRPLVTKKISRWQAHFIGSICLGNGLVILFLVGGWVPMLLACTSFLHYVFIYTMWLKPRTHWNTFWGGIAGSVGPLVSNAAIHGSITDLGILMFVFLFLWQPPHFWILGLVYRQDYKSVNIPILPTIINRTECLQQIFNYYILLTLVMIASTFWLQMTSLIFLLPSLAFSIWVLIEIWQRKKSPQAKMIYLFFIALAHMMVWHIALSVDLWFTRFT